MIPLVQREYLITWSHASYKGPAFRCHVNLSSPGRMFSLEAALIKVGLIPRAAGTSQTFMAARPPSTSHGKVHSTSTKIQSLVTTWSCPFIQVVLKTWSTPSKPISLFNKSSAHIHLPAFALLSVMGLLQTLLQPLYLRNGS